VGKELSIELKMNILIQMLTSGRFSISKTADGSYTVVDNGKDIEVGKHAASCLGHLIHLMNSGRSAEEISRRCALPSFQITGFTNKLKDFIRLSLNFSLISTPVLIALSQYIVASTTHPKGSIKISETLDL